MSRETAIKTGLYLYAIVPAGTEADLGDIGLDGAHVQVVRQGELAAVVSEVPTKKLRPERRNLAAHDAVLRALMDRETPLPVAFGIVADDADELKRVLAREQHRLVEQLQKVRGRVEMGLKVNWDVANIFEHILSMCPDLKQMRDDLFADGRQPSRDEKIELGRMFDEMVGQKRDQCATKVVAALEAEGFEVKRLAPRTEKSVLNLAVLIGREHKDQFTQAVERAAGEFDDTYAFHLDGPWPPSNFIDLRLRLEKT